MFWITLWDPTVDEMVHCCSPGMAVKRQLISMKLCTKLQLFQVWQWLKQITMRSAFLIKFSSFCDLRSFVVQPSRVSRYVTLCLLFVQNMVCEMDTYFVIFESLLLKYVVCSCRRLGCMRFGIWFNMSTRAKYSLLKMCKRSLFLAEKCDV